MKVSRNVVPALVALLMVVMGPSAVAHAASAESSAAPASPTGVERIILFVLEGVGKRSLEIGPMPTLTRLATEGSVTWTATSPAPDLRLPSMASLFTGLPIEKHGITWNEFDFARGYPRPATLFDYMDLSGGKDTAIFVMDESLYQLARPEPYIDYQICGALRPECTPETLVSYIRDYMVKGASGEGYGRRILALPDLLIVHLPQPARVGPREGWASPAYGAALHAVDRAIADVMAVYRELGLLEEAAIIVTALSGRGEKEAGANGAADDRATNRVPGRVPWIVWGPGIKQGHEITRAVSLLDTGATIMRTLGLETYTDWDSRPIEEVFVAPRSAAPGGASP